MWLSGNFPVWILRPEKCIIINHSVNKRFHMLYYIPRMMQPVHLVFRVGWCESHRYPRGIYFTRFDMMTSSNGNIFRVTGPLCGKFTGPGEFPHKGQWRGVLIASLICVWINGWVNNREAGDLRRYCAHYDVTVMEAIVKLCQRQRSSPKEFRRINHTNPPESLITTTGQHKIVCILHGI